jgi:hypothetical protein
MTDRPRRVAESRSGAGDRQNGRTGTNLARLHNMIMRSVRDLQPRVQLTLVACVLAYLDLPWLTQLIGGSGISLMVEVADTWLFLSILLLSLWLADPRPDAR